MKKILLISDTHGYIDERILYFASLADEVWHAGDVGSLEVISKLKEVSNLKAVYGNIDGNEIRQLLPLNNIFLCEQVKVFITHIGGYPKNYKPGIKFLLEEHKPDIFICGHSHILKVIRDSTLDVLHMNPGACGKHGFHKIRTLLRFEINKKEIENLEVVELESKN
ncbi:MAG: metallophosphoesterase [Solirubrobacteraceae bacterium]